MKWDLWRPKYEEIVERLDLDPEADRRAGKILRDFIKDTEISELKALIETRESIVFGAGPSLEKDLERLDQAGWLEKVLISADGATSAVMNYRIPEVIVTDLDGEIEDQLESWRRGSWIVLHAHGDNIERIRDIAPRLQERVLGTIQVDSPRQLYNFGGFTDGDRAAFMAHELGATKIYLSGMDLGVEIGEYSGKTKKKQKIIKLEICGELLSWLAEDLGAKVANITFGGKEIPNVSRLDFFE